MRATAASRLAPPIRVARWTHEQAEEDDAYGTGHGRGEERGVGKSGRATTAGARPCYRRGNQESSRHGPHDDRSPHLEPFTHPVAHRVGRDQVGDRAEHRVHRSEQRHRVHDRKVPEIPGPAEPAEGEQRHESPDESHRRLEEGPDHRGTRVDQCRRRHRRHDRDAQTDDGRHRTSQRGGGHH